MFQCVRQLIKTSFAVVTGEMMSAAAKRMPAIATLYSEAELQRMSHEDLVRLVLLLQTQQKQVVSDMRENSELRRTASEESSGTKATSPKKKRQKRQFDMTKYGQRMIALRLAYLGWCHHGLASQTNSDNAVEDHLFKALRRTHLIDSRESAVYSRSGRTDVGVSASDQIVGVRVRSNIVPPSCGGKEIDYVKTLNANLPKTIRVLAWAPAPDSGEGGLRKWKDDERRRPGTPFSARFDAVYRAYKYFFVKGRMNIESMRKAAAHLVGRHDFRNFCKVDPANKSFERVLYEADVRRNGTIGKGEYEQYYIFVRGQAFLWHQVRCMAAILFEVGCGRESPDVTLRMLLDVRNGSGSFANGKPHYQMASPTPLLLCECAYPGGMLDFRSSLRYTGNTRLSSFQKADHDVAMAFADASAKATILRSLLDENDESIVLNEGGSQQRYRDVRKSRLLVEKVASTHKKAPLEKRACRKPVEEIQKKIKSEVSHVF